MQIFNPTEHNPEQALELPTGRLAANFGFLIEQTVEPKNVFDAATALKEAGVNKKLFTQADVMVEAQKQGVWGTDWAAELSTFS